MNINFSTVDVLGVSISNITMSDAVNIASSFLHEEKNHLIFTPNAECVMATQRDHSLAHVYNRADLVIPDGAGVVLGAKILGTPIREKVAGCDLMLAILASERERSRKVFLFGATEGVAEAAKKVIIRDFPGVAVVGVENGIDYIHRENEIIKRINDSGAEILFVALGAPRQEIWLEKHRDSLCVRVSMGVGGSFDVLSGKVKRAPIILQRLSLEWFYRLCKEPWRWRRMLDLPRFVFRVIRVAVDRRNRKHE